MLPVIAICLGASIGALCRWGLSLWLSPGGAIPWGTLAANLIGGYLIGVCIAMFHGHAAVRSGLATAFDYRLFGRTDHLLVVFSRGS